MISTCRKINTISVNTKTNLPKLANTCGYKLVTNWQNFTKIFLAKQKYCKKVFLGGESYFFDSQQTAKDIFRLYNSTLTTSLTDLVSS